MVQHKPLLTTKLGLRHNSGDAAVENQ